MTADTPTPDCINCKTGWADGPLCRQHANDQIERLKSALAGRTQSCSQCDEAADEIERLQAFIDALMMHSIEDGIVYLTTSHQVWEALSDDR